MKDRAVVMVVDGGRLLVMQVTEPDKQYFTLPGGGVEPGETVEEAVVRDWITEDHADGFKKRSEVTMKISELRQTF